jgi:hypothetical protein
MSFHEYKEKFFSDLEKLGWKEDKDKIGTSFVIPAPGQKK